MVMSHLQIEKMNIMVLTTVLPSGVKYDKIEPWFNINYTSQGMVMPIYYNLNMQRVSGGIASNDL